MLKVLLICPWVVSLSALRAVLRAEAVAVEIVRIDFEAALRVALIHDRFAAMFYTPTPGLAAALVEAAVREHAPKLALHRADCLDRVAELVVALAQASRS